MSDPDERHQEIGCADRASAEAEAASQQQSENDPSMEWIYLRNGEEQWVARRVPRTGDGPEPKKSRGERIFDGALDFLGDMFS